MDKMIINGKDVAHGRVVTALEAMLDGADNARLRKLHCGRWDDQFYHVDSEIFDFCYMVRKEFNCLTVWISYSGPTSFEGGDETVQRLYHPLCILTKKDTEHDFDPEWNDMCMDLVNGLIRMRLLCANEYITPDYKED